MYQYRHDVIGSYNKCLSNSFAKWNNNFCIWYWMNKYKNIHIRKTLYIHPDFSLLLPFVKKIKLKYIISCASLNLHIRKRRVSPFAIVFCLFLFWVGGIKSDQIHQYYLDYLTGKLYLRWTWSNEIDVSKNRAIKQKEHNQNPKSKRQDYNMKKRDTNDRTTCTSIKTRGEIRFSGRVSISCSACGTSHDVPYFVSRNET